VGQFELRRGLTAGSAATVHGLFISAMKPFIVRVRSAPSPNNPAGDMLLYVSVFDTKMAAMDAVREIVPKGWKVEEVVGELDPYTAKRKALRPGDVAQLP
jgi:hypothetical protein